MYRFLSLLFSLCFAIYGFAQISFRTNAPGRADINGQIRVQFELNGAEGSDFRQPSLGDFDVLAGPNVSTSNSIVITNGRTQTSASTVYTYILAPKHNGALHIGAASVRAGGKVYQTRPLTIQVSGKANPNAASGASNTAAASDVQAAGSRIAAKDIYFTSEVSKKTIYEQEPIMLSYRYHVRQGVAVVNIMPTGKPEMKGFWTQEVELPRNLSPEAANIGGKLYRVGTNLQYLIFPQQSGKLTIPALTFRSDVVQRNASIDEIDAFFNGGNNINIPVDRDAPAVAIEVLPLPKPQPADFSGGVGQLYISAGLITPIPKTNDVATLRVIVSGKGNLKLVKAPQVVFPKGFDTYSPKTNDHVRVTTSGIDGTMEFDYTFVPRNIGKYTIPSIALVYFDPQSKSYVTKKTEPIALNIEKGTKAYAPISASQEEDIRNLHENKGNAFAESGILWIGHWSYWLTLTLLLALIAMGSHFLPNYWAQRSDLQGRTSQRAGKKAHKRLQKVEKLMNAEPSAAFYDALSTALMGYFAEKFHLEQAAITHQIIEQQLTERGVSSELTDEIMALLSDIDFGRFAPTSENTRQELYQRANELLTSLQHSLR